MGLVDQVFANSDSLGSIINKDDSIRDDPMDGAMDFARQLSRNAPLTIVGAKKY
jgi:hypothetical protein